MGHKNRRAAPNRLINTSTAPSSCCIVLVLLGRLCLLHQTAACRVWLRAYSPPPNFLPASAVAATAAAVNACPYPWSEHAYFCCCTYSNASVGLSINRNCCQLPFFSPTDEIVHAGYPGNAHGSTTQPRPCTPRLQQRHGTMRCAPLTEHDDLELVVAGQHTSTSHGTQDVGASTLEQGLHTLVLHHLRGQTRTQQSVSTVCPLQEDASSCTVTTNAKAAACIPSETPPRQSLRQASPSRFITNLDCVTGPQQPTSCVGGSAGPLIML